MSNVPSVVADAVASVFTLSAELSEKVAVAAEMAADASFDFSKACDSIAAVLGAIKADGVLTFESWESVRIQFESVAAVRARDNGAVDPAGAANDCWNRVDRRNREIHGLVKPKSAKPESVEKAQRREAEKAKLLASAGGRSASELKGEIRAMYGEASDESIAKAKSLEKALKVVENIEKDSVSAQMKPLVNAANDQHKKVMEFLKTKNDPKILGDYVVLLKRTLDIWQTGK